MSNRSYLYSVDYNSLHEDGKIKTLGLSEVNYRIPLSYKILVSQDSKVVHSNIWDYKYPMAIEGSFKEGEKKLHKFLLNIIEHDIFEEELLNKRMIETVDFLKANELERIILECGEIFQMSEEAFEVQNMQLFKEEILDIDKVIACVTTELKILKFDYQKIKKIRNRCNQKQNMFSRFFLKNKKEDIIELEKSMQDIKQKMWDIIGIDIWKNELFYDLTKK